MKPIKTAGALSWSELQTTDLEGASSFYRSIFGWDLESMELSDGKYTVGSILGGPVAGMTHKIIPEVPTVWGFYATAHDVDATITKARALGGIVLHEPWNAPGVGRMGVFRDPQGAVLHVISYNDPDHDAHQTEYESSYAQHGAFSWFELRVPDATSAANFYAELFGWEVEVVPMEFGPYHLFKVDGIGMGGIMSIPSQEMRPHWGAYVTVNDVDEFAKKVALEGGEVVDGPVDIPNIGRSVLFTDPQGAMLSGIKYAPMEAM